MMTFSNGCILLTIGSIYATLGEFVKLGVHFINSQTCTNPIIHLFYPPKFFIIIVCNFFWDMKMSQGKSKTMPMQIVWG